MGRSWAGSHGFSGRTPFEKRARQSDRSKPFFRKRKGSQRHSYRRQNLALPVLHSVEYRGYDYAFSHAVNFIHDDVGQTRHDPFEPPGNVTNTPDEGE
jgi:hypothetical protein